MNVFVKENTYIEILYELWINKKRKKKKDECLMSNKLIKFKSKAM